MKTLGALFALWLGLTALTYVPFFVEVTPGLLTAPVAKVPIQYEVLEDDEEARAIIDDGCHKMPFWTRAISNYPRETRLIVLDGLTELGEILVDCRDGSLQDMKTYPPGRTWSDN